MEYKITWQEIQQRLSNYDRSKKYWGVPRGGSVLAAMLNPVMTIQECDIIIDDLIDSGKTYKKYKELYPNKEFKALFNKQTEPLIKNKWLVFPYEETGSKDMEDLIRRQLQYIGEDPERIGLIETPKRIVNMWNEIYAGYKDSKPKVTLFPNGQDGIIYDAMIMDKGNFYSICEHHLMPFFGNYYFSYIPHQKGEIIGLSKIARVVNYFAAKLQIQERLCSDIINYIDSCFIKEYKPLGMAILMRAEHLCKTMRGVKKQGQMTTTYLTGIFKTDTDTRNEFLNNIK